MNSNSTEILSFLLDEHRFAIPLKSVERVLRAVEVTQIPDSPEMIYGVIDYYGEVIAVLNLRHKFKMINSPVNINDRFILVKTEKRKVVLVVDEVIGVVTPHELEINDAAQINPGLKITKVMCDSSGILFIYDLELLMNTIDEIQLEKMIELAEVA